MPAPIVSPDFEAEVRFLTSQEGGRRGPAIQGYRPDISFDGDPVDHVFMVWPWFMNGSGRDFEDGATIPETALARFYVVSTNARPILRKRIVEGSRFYLNEGQKRVAVCRVTKLLNLHEDAA